MAREKKSMIGFDPLAWLDDGADTNEKETSQEDKKAVVKTKKKPTEKKKKDSAKMLKVLGHSIDETALLKGYELAESVLDEVTVHFYNELFTQHSELTSLFENTSETAQAGKFSAALKLLIDNLHNEEALKTVLTAMGERHQKYAALPEHYPVVAELLIASFKKIIGRSWTKNISAAWMKLLVAAAETMCAAYQEEVTEVETIEPGKDMKSEPEEKESEHPVLQLNSIQDISKSQVLKHDMLALVNDNDVIDIQASEVERIDGSALQLLCALFGYAEQNNLVINWINPSDALKESAQTLGVQAILELSD